jgi:hypothetical protein
VPDVGFVEPTWARLASRPLIDSTGMAKLLGEPRGRLQRMQALASPPAREAQLGCCPSCLRSDLRATGAPYWRRAWMDPYVAVCGVHRRLLRPVNGSAVRPLLDVQRSIALMRSLAADEGGHVIPQMAPCEINTIARLQRQMKVVLSRPRLLRMYVDAIASRVHQTDGTHVVVSAPRLGGWLAGVRDLYARQELLQRVVRASEVEIRALPDVRRDASRTPC